MIKRYVYWPSEVAHCLQSSGDFSPCSNSIALVILTLHLHTTKKVYKRAVRTVCISPFLIDCMYVSPTPAALINYSVLSCPHLVKPAALVATCSQPSFTWDMSSIIISIIKVIIECLSEHVGWGLGGGGGGGGGGDGQSDVGRKNAIFAT